MVEVARLVVPASVEVIGEECFSPCKFLIGVLFGEGSRLRRLEKGCFMSAGLTRVVIPASVEVIGEECFAGCESLGEVVYEGQVDRIDIAENAFPVHA
jgi:hypothetical protein